jgi:CubicO group peptidase (beta-lactamase class C family)
MQSTTQRGIAPTQSLPRRDPSELGISSDDILAFIDAINARLGGLHGLMLLCRGNVVAETWWAPYSPHRRHLLWSLSKSFTSTAVGLAVHDGHFSVDDRVISFFPDELPAKVSDRLAAMRVKDLLLMSTGHGVEPQVKPDDNWVRAFLAAEVVHEPGTHFLYNTPATHVLSAIVQKRTGQRLLDYLTPRLFEPLGITESHWEQSPLGIDIGGYGLSLRLESVAKFGQLYLQKGKWKDVQLIPAAWIDEATTAHVSNGDPSTGGDWNQGYGYQFWRSRHNSYRADGAFGQYCLVLPEHDAVLAINANQADASVILDLAWKHILPALTGGGGKPLKIPPQAVPFPSGSASSSIANKVSGKDFSLERNLEGIRALRLTFEKDRCLLDVFAEGRRFTLPIGLSDWLEGVHFVDGKPQPIASRGTWETDSTFAAKICFTDRPDDWSQRFVFEGDKLTVTDRKIRYGFTETDRPDLRGTLAEGT